MKAFSLDITTDFDFLEILPNNRMTAILAGCYSHNQYQQLNSWPLAEDEASGVLGAEGAPALVEAEGTGNVVEAVRHECSIMGEIRALHNMDDDEVFAYANRIAAPYDLVMQTKQLGRLPVVQFATGNVATPADAALMMQPGCDGVFVSSGIFKSGDPARRAHAIVQAVTHCRSSRPSTPPPRRPRWHTFAVELCPVCRDREREEEMNGEKERKNKEYGA
nr:probable pyridoxal 5'-phosphate synthase subunit PDX1 [Oryza sativa Japonica Group]